MVAQAQAWWGSLDEKQQKTIGGVACELTATLPYTALPLPHTQHCRSPARRAAVHSMTAPLLL